MKKLTKLNLKKNQNEKPNKIIHNIEVFVIYLPFDKKKTSLQYLTNYTKLIVY